jgi:cytoskeletal protein CcmA (bactofilin family)
MVVGPETSIEGEVAGPGDLVVRGRVRGRVSMGGTVRLEAESDVHADIRAPRVVIVDGASFQGEVDTSGAARPEASAVPADPASGATGMAALARRIRLRGT